VRFLGGAIRWLEGIYDTVGSRLPTVELDTGGVSLTHDVGENAAYASGKLLKAGGTDGQKTLPPAGLVDYTRGRAITVVDEAVVPDTGSGWLHQRNVDSLIRSVVGNPSPSIDYWLIDAYLAATDETVPIRSGFLSLIQRPRGAGRLDSAGNPATFPRAGNSVFPAGTYFEPFLQRPLIYFDVSTVTPQAPPVARGGYYGLPSTGFSVYRRMFYGPIRLEGFDYFQWTFRGDVVEDQFTQCAYELYAAEKGTLPPVGYYGL